MCVARGTEPSPMASEGVEAMHFRYCAGRRGAGTMMQDADAEVCPGMIESDAADVAV